MLSSFNETKDPTDTQQIWTIKRCILQVTILPNETWAKRNESWTGGAPQGRSAPCLSQLVGAIASRLCIFFSPSLCPTGTPSLASLVSLLMQIVKSINNAWAGLEPLQDYQKPRSEKIEIFLQETEEVKMLYFSLCALHSTYKEEWQCECVLPVHTHLPSHTHTHTFIFSSFTQNSDIAHCCRGGYCLYFGYFKFQIYEYFFATRGGKDSKTHW